MSSPTKPPVIGRVGKIFLILIGLFVLGKVVGEQRRSYEPVAEATPVTVEEGASRAETAGSGLARVDATLLPSERENYARDPTSHGFSDDDRDFLREHGVSEDEARAAETIIREQGN